MDQPPWSTVSHTHTTTAVDAARYEPMTVTWQNHSVPRVWTGPAQTGPTQIPIRVGPC